MGNMLLYTSIPVTFAAASYVFAVTRPSAAVRHLPCHFDETVHDSFLSSQSVTCTINPKGHIHISDSARLELPARYIHGLSDEEILARFVKGYFGGWTFAIERNLLRLLGLRIVRFSNIPESSEPLGIWSPAQISYSHLPEPRSVLFGAFQVVDSHIETNNRLSISDTTSTNPALATSVPAKSQLSKANRMSYIDFGFGSATSIFSGMHRFSVQRQSNNDVLIRCDHMSCNPTVNKPLRPEFLKVLHRIYAPLLFKEGTASIINGRT